MTEHTNPLDEVLAAMATLGSHEPDHLRDARLRARCHAALVKSRRREAVRDEPGWRFALGVALAPTVIGVLCAVYLFEVISRAMQLYRF